MSEPRVAHRGRSIAWWKVLFAVAAVAGLSGSEGVSAEPTSDTVAFAVHSVGGKRPAWIVMSDLDGSNLRAVTPQPNRGARRRDSLPTFSPDGARVAFFRKDGKRSGLYVATLNAGSSKRVAAGDAQRFEPTGPPLWSPDGQKIAFGLVGPTCPLANPRNAGIYITRLNNGTTRRLPALVRNRRALPSFLTVEAWSPGGTRLLYSEDQFGGDEPCRGIACCNGAVYAIAASGGKPSVVQKPAASAFYGVGWSSDGKMLAYEDCQGFECSVVVRTPRGVREYGDGTASVGAAWAPQEHRLAVTIMVDSSDASSRSLHLDLIDVDRDAVVDLGDTHLPFPVVDALAWSRDGTRIVTLADWPPRSYVFSPGGETVRSLRGPRAPKGAALDDSNNFSFFLP